MVLAMDRRCLSVLGVACTALAFAACDYTKSSNPLSPTVQGPIPGVNISAPRAMQPSAGTKIAVDKQPVTLTVGNADSNGVRPLTYAFDVAADVNFTNKVFSRAGVTPGDGGQTSLKLPDSLAPERTYYWRAHAEDGANTGTFTAAINFDVFTPIVIQAPRPIGPGANSTIDTIHPTLVVANAVHSGPVGAITYQAEIANDALFGSKIATWTTAEGAGQTGLTVPNDLGYSKTYYWHVRALDPTTVGPWSPTLAFVTPAQIIVAPPGGGGGGCAGASPDILCQATVLNSPRDLASWAVTSRITSVTFQSDSFPVEFDKRTGPGHWPDSPFGDGGGGTIEYTLGMCLKIGSQWYCSAPVQFWYGRELTATGPPSQVATNWFYDPGRWAPMTGHQPADGEQVGIFACAGNCRNNSDGSLSVVHERTNVVLVPFSNGGGTSYPF